MLSSHPHLRVVRVVSILSLGVATLLLAPGVAHAGISACGDIDILAGAQCEVVNSTACTTQCVATSFEKCCAAKLELSCNSTCNATAEASCTESCGNDCTTTCTANPGSTTCDTSCTDTCQASCSASCTSSSTQTDCQASCGACCSDHCDTSCVTIPASSSCTTTCNASCAASCTAEANTSCQVKCQESSYDSCKSDYVDTCTTQCNQTGGALFCNGDYVDVGDNLDDCVTAANGVLTTPVTISLTVQASATCSDGTCKTTETTTTSCAASSAPAPRSPFLAISALVMLLAAGARRRLRA